MFFKDLCELAQRFLVRGVLYAAVAGLVIPSPLQAQNSVGDANSTLQNLNLNDLANRLGSSANDSQTNAPSVESQTNVLRPNLPYQYPLPQSDLEKYYSQRAGADLKQFGYDSFGRPSSVTTRQMGALQDTYILGSGDTVNVSLVGQENTNLTARVDRDGNLQLPKLPPIPAAGRRLADVRSDIERQVKTAYLATQVFVSVGAVRQISVLVSGEVAAPGTIVLNALNSPIDALLLAGGVKKTGSLRHIVIVRGDKRIPVDLYVALAGKGTLNVSLADGDRIVVPPLSDTVAITGDVTRPGIYEIGPGAKSVSSTNLLAFAGGFMHGGTPRLSVLKVNSSGAQLFQPANARSVSLGKGDILFVEPQPGPEHGRVALSGQVRSPGIFDLTRAPTLRALLGSPDVYEEQPYMVFAAISRRDPKTLARTLIPFAPAKVVQGTFDLPLQDDDIVRVFSVPEVRILAAQLKAEDNARNPESRDLRTVQQTTQYVQNPNTPQQQGTGTLNGSGGTVGAALAGNTSASGGMQAPPYSAYGQGAYTYDQYGQVSGINGAPAQTSVLPDQSRGVGIFAGTQTLAQGQTQPNAAAGNYGNPPNTATQFYPAYPSNLTPLPPGSQGYQPSYPGQPVQAQAGQGVPPGVQQGLPMYSNQAPPPQYDPTQQPFSRNNLVFDLGDPSLRSQLANYRVTLLGAVAVTGDYLAAPGVGLDSLVEAAGGLTRTADLTSIEVTSTDFDTQTGKATTTRTDFSVAPAQLGKIALRSRDVIRFRDVYSDRDHGQVVVRGQVRFPGSFDLLRGERLSSLLARAGGLTDIAYPAGAVFTRESAARAEEDGYRRAAEELEREFTVLVSSSDQASVVSPQGVQFIRETIQRLQTAQGVGRISVDADPVSLGAHPSRDTVLEPGDFLFIPRRPNSVSVTGEVLSAGSYLFSSGEGAKHYIRLAGGYALGADRSRTFVLMPDGTAQPINGSLLAFRGAQVVPGATIIVPRNLEPFRLRRFVIDLSQIFSQLAVSAASIAVIQKG